MTADPTAATWDLGRARRQAARHLRHQPHVTRAEREEQECHPAFSCKQHRVPWGRTCYLCRDQLPLFPAGPEQGETSVPGPRTGGAA